MIILSPTSVHQHCHHPIILLFVISLFIIIDDYYLPSNHQGTIGGDSTDKLFEATRLPGSPDLDSKPPPKQVQQFTRPHSR